MTSRSRQLLASVIDTKAAVSVINAMTTTSFQSHPNGSLIIDTPVPKVPEFAVLH
jgi:hypothetical protein